MASFGTVSSVITSMAGGDTATLTVNTVSSSGMLVFFQQMNDSGGPASLISSHLTWALRSSLVIRRALFCKGRQEAWRPSVCLGRLPGVIEPSA